MAAAGWGFVSIDRILTRGRDLAGPAREIGVTVFEISVKAGPLTDAEMKQLVE